MHPIHSNCPDTNQIWLEQRKVSVRTGPKLLCPLLYHTVKVYFVPRLLPFLKILYVC